MYSNSREIVSMANMPVHEEGTLTLHYENKDWLVTICGLNGVGLIPGQNLLEKHISKKECIDMLEALHHTVQLATGGQEAVRMLTAGKFDLVFTDLAMPEMDGWETAREIRKRTPEMNIVLVTGYGAGTLPPVGESHLVNAIIGKPFDFEQVIQAIAEVTGRHAELEEIIA